MMAIFTPPFLQVFVSVPTGVFAGIILSALVYVWQSKSTFKFEIFYDKDTDTKVRSLGKCTWRPFVTCYRTALKQKDGNTHFWEFHRVMPTHCHLSFFTYPPLCFAYPLPPLLSTTKSKAICSTRRKRCSRGCSPMKTTAPR